jgi:hypothetical protein
MEEVATVRKMLGKKDLDFRFWLFEEEIIYSSAWQAYFKNHNYEPNDYMEENVVKSIRACPEFEAFKKVKTNELGSSQKVISYFEIRSDLVKERFLFQNISTWHRNLITTSGKKIKDEIAVLAERLNSIN